MLSSAFLRIHAVYRALGRSIAHRHATGDGMAEWDWAIAEAVESISLTLPGTGAAAPRIEVALRDGFPPRVLPRSLRIPGLGDSVALRAVRAARATAQGAPGVLRESEPRIAGTATCLVRDRLAPDRNYVITCGHVAAPDKGARVDQIINIDDAGHARAGRLVDWQPSIGIGEYRTSIDAALVEVAAGDAIALRDVADFTPAGLGPSPLEDMQVSLHRRGAPVPGALKVYWSGYIDLPGLNSDITDYFLADAVGYLCAESTRAGDSGAAIWDASDRLMGMHIGGLPDTGPGNANAVYGPIGPVLDWYSVQPYLQGDAATLRSAPPPGVAQDQRHLSTPAAGPSGATSDEEVAIVAATLWGEARNQGEQGMRAVACVINNRWRAKYRGKTTPSAVCLDPKQFSCWNPGDPNLPRMQRIASSPDSAYFTACAIARELLQGTLQDITNGARHYYASTLRPPAYWSRGKSPCKVIGDHRFYNDID